MEREEIAAADGRERRRRERRAPTTCGCTGQSSVPPEAVLGSPRPRMNDFGNRLSCLPCGAGCPACRIADGPTARRVKNEALPCSPRAWFPSSPRRLGSLRYSRQGCLRYHDNPVTANL